MSFRNKKTKVTIKTPFITFEFTINQERKVINKKIINALNDNKSYICLETESADYIFFKKWLHENSFINLASIDEPDYFEGVVEEATKIVLNKDIGGEPQ